LIVPKDGIYIFELSIESPGPNFNANTTVKFVAEHGMLTAKDLPLLNVSLIFKKKSILKIYFYFSFMHSCVCIIHSLPFFGRLFHQSFGDNY
jgi:hypothetical protein